MTSSPARPFLRRPVVRAALAAVVVLFALALAAFEPWNLWIDRTVDEPVPPGAVVVASGELITHEHATTGTVQVLALPDGSRVLRLADLATTNGPLLTVLVSDAPVLPGRDGWFVFDDVRHVDLGELKGNIGSSNYVLPPDVDLARLPSVSVWCDRFDVSFGAATLRPAP
ncbi:MAG: DM13 domain-containing protein [Pseudonocardia sp.]